MNEMQAIELLLSCLNNNPYPSTASTAPTNFAMNISNGWPTINATPTNLANSVTFPVHASHQGSVSTNPMQIVQGFVKEALSSQRGLEMLAGLDGDLKAICLKVVLEELEHQMTPANPVLSCSPPSVPPASSPRATPIAAFVSSFGPRPINQNAGEATLDQRYSVAAGTASNPSELRAPSLHGEKILSSHECPENPRGEGTHSNNVSSPVASMERFSDPESPSDERRQRRQAASSRSSQQSRKRKKQFMENLAEENHELQKLRLMLDAAPDLILSFDSSGVLRYLSASCVDFLSAEPKDLIGTSFWNLLSMGSAKLIQTAFMDSLAERKPGVSSTPLGSQVHKITLSESDATNPHLFLRGAIYYPSEGSPECVCMIHKKDE